MTLYSLKSLGFILFYFFLISGLKANAGQIHKGDRHYFVQTDAFKLYQKTFDKHEIILLNDGIVRLGSRKLDKVSIDKLAFVDYINGAKEVRAFLYKKGLDKKVKKEDSITNVLIVSTAKSKKTATTIRNIPFFTKLKKAEFPSKGQGWGMFLKRNLKSQLPADNGAPEGKYSVTVSFLINRAGEVTEAKALNDPGFGSAQEAVRVIAQSPKWTAASMFGKKVTYRQTQKIIFNVTDDGEQDSILTVKPDDLLIQTKSFEIFKHNLAAIIILNNRIVSRDNDDLANLKIKDLASADYIFDSTVVKAIALTFPDKYDFQISLRANYLHQLRRTLTEKQYDSIANTPIFSERLNEIPKYIYRNVLNLETTKTAKSTKQIDSLAFIRPPTKPVFTDDGTNWDNFLTTNLKADIAVKNG
ncbi:MAG: hypothetical protein ACQR30_14935, partial [Arachidicoccus sp.]